MGSSKSETNSNYNQNQNQSQIYDQNQGYSNSQGSQSQINFKPRSPEEAQLLGQVRNLGNYQDNFLQGLMSGQSSPFALNAQDQAQLDQAYQSAFDRFNLEGKDYADYLATTRGLNKSDTPVSQQAMQRYGLGMSDLLSQKANMGLNMGLQGTGLRLQGSGMLPAGITNAFNALYNERLAAPTTTVTGSNSGSSFARGNSQSWGNTNGTQNSSTTNTPSLMSQIGQGMGLAGQALGLGAGIASLGMGGGAMSGMAGLGGIMSSGGGGMGSGAAANSWFGPTPGQYKVGGMPSFY